MEILIHGNPEKFNLTVTFQCHNCGCRFKADKTEYRKESLLAVDFYYCDCPECGEKSDEFVEEGEEK